MREIKFRAWDKKTNIMESWGNITDYMVYQPWWKHPDLELMQYTGLKDKNGREIYEGDIIKDVSGYAYTDMVFEVCFGGYDNGMDYEDAVSGYGWYGKVIEGWLGKGNVKGLDVISDCKVIGNIYENPELLNKGSE